VPSLAHLILQASKGYTLQHTRNLPVSLAPPLFNLIGKPFQCGDVLRMHGVCFRAHILRVYGRMSLDHL
jgi:hypothetical protein